MSEGPVIPPGTVLPPLHSERSEPHPSQSQGDRSGKSKGNDNRNNGKGKATAKGKGRGDRRETADRFAVLNAFVDRSMADLTRAELAVWMVLYRDTRNGTARTSADDIGRRIGVSTRRTLDAIARLRRRELVDRLYKGGLNRGPSVYRVHPLPREPA